jgi:pSer/pThr/pTyr-binding forkhead associated (FHA) protein
LIGRDYDALVRIDDAKVSRRHARITIEGESATVEDLRSTHGTLLNDEPVRRPSPLRNGDRIGIGAFLFVFRSHPV